ncbi:MAG TPA: tetratricopeptide repeat protein [Kofleriaceae bacterium]|nr:tetratricopeptide repeat protein [Kofleriaceae bacterium]
MKRAALLALLVANVAHANVWDDALRRGEPDVAQDKYDSEMKDGDEHTLLANTRGTSKKEVLHQLQLAITSYKAAAAAKPNEGEPWFRLGRLIHSFYLECSDGYQLQPSMRPLTCPERNPNPPFDKAHAEECIGYWAEFEKRAPLDPRLSVGMLGSSDILFERAILHTRLATHEHLALAAADYEKILSREDLTDGANENVIGNLAETYMMLNRLDEAIETYREALRGASDTSTWYGFAVALDRDERSRQALEVIQSLGREQRDQFHLKVIKGDTFFVPEGEKFYYFALSDEAFDFDDEAIDNWKRFIDSGAHPQFQPRAKAHLEALLVKKKRTKPSSSPFDPPWRGILR